MSTTGKKMLGISRIYESTRASKNRLQQKFNVYTQLVEFIEHFYEQLIWFWERGVGGWTFTMAKTHNWKVHAFRNLLVSCF